MTAFEFCLYAAAVLFVFWARAGAPLPGDMPAVPIAPIVAPEVKPHPVPAVAAALAAPVAIARVEVEPVAAIDYAKMTSAQLRKECSKATPRICWRDAHGKGKHLRKEEMVKALA